MSKTWVFLLFVGFLTHNSLAYAKLTATSFPTTIADVSFVDRVENLRVGYEPFQDMSAYRVFDIEEGEEYYSERELAQVVEQQQFDAKTLSEQEYCAKYPLDATRCTQTPELQNQVYATGGAQSGSFNNTGYTGATIGGGTVVANNVVHNQSCYLATKDSVFTNKVLTSGKYEKIDSAFEKGLITVFRKEGRCGTIKNDPCGYTCFGFGEKCNPDIDVRNLTRPKAEDLYYERYYAKYGIHKLPDVIRGDIFIASMASGPCTAIKQFRKFLGSGGTGCKITDADISAAERYNGDLHNDWMDVRQKFLADVATKRYNNSVLQGYMNAIRLKRNNGCHVVPSDPIFR